jgi:Protein of unknown function (DUF4058)
LKRSSAKSTVAGALRQRAEKDLRHKRPPKGQAKSEADVRARVITAIELLSPSNKEEAEPRLAWKRKRLDYLRGGISLVEIDLLRGGGWTLPDHSLLKPVPPGRVYHHACMTRPP